jgi:Phosphatidylserine/phosphatidylglycerophosphate/cardiolipin synthases and related enzymes
MELIRNTRGGCSKLEELHRSAIKDAERVQAAVAYVTAERPFFETCWQERKPLVLYARYDHTGPIAPVVLDWFLSKSMQSANYELRLVPDIFHPKVIWWRKVGVYIGSANLTTKAWFGNFEAGVFLTEEEIEDAEMREELEDFFAEIHAASHSLNKETAAEMKRMAADVFGREDYRIEKEFNKSRLIPQLASLISVTRIPRRDRNRSEFLREWNQTLQYLRDISERLSRTENRPVWIPAEAPKGVLADQFLHAFYYNQVRDGNHYPYRELYNQNHANRENALTKAIDWWSKLETAPSREDVHIKEWATEVRRMLAPGVVRLMSEADFVEVCVRIHAMREHAARMGHKAFGLAHRLQTMEKDERTKYFARWLFKQRAPNGSTPCDLIDFVLHDGAPSETPERLFSAYSDPEHKIPHIGVSTLGEMIGWAMPDEFPPRNGRTSKALTALGYDVAIHSE